VTEFDEDNVRNSYKQQRQQQHQCFFA